MACDPIELVGQAACMDCFTEGQLDALDLNLWCLVFNGAGKYPVFLIGEGGEFILGEGGEYIQEQ